MRLVKQIAFLLILIPIYSFSQQEYGNEWIEDYSQNYFKVPIYKEGVYRIDFDVLNDDPNINVSVLDPRNFQIFHNGSEQYIYVKGETDGSFDSVDYIEFYGNKNDGTLDSLLYDNSSSQPHTKYSLFTDTAYYFLTWNTSTSNKRMEILSDNDFSGYTSADAEPYFIHPIFEYFTDAYHKGKPLETNQGSVGNISYYSEGQGWTSTVFSNGSSISKSLNNNQIYASGPSAEIEIGVVGESNDQIKNPDHYLTLQFATPTLTKIEEFEGYSLQRFTYMVNSSNISDNLGFTLTSSNKYSSDRVHLSYISMKYPRTFDLSNSSSFNLIIPESSLGDPAYLEITNFSTNNTSTYIYDLTNHKRIQAFLESSKYKALVPNSGGDKECYLTFVNQIVKLSSLTKVDFTDYENRNAGYLILTHKKLESSVDNYKTYRESVAGGSFDVFVVTSDELYDQFSYGVKTHPLSVNNFIAFADTNWDSLKYVFIIGNGYQDEFFRFDDSYFNDIMVPTYGNPPSDNLLATDIFNKKTVPRVPIGRLAAKTTADVDNYLEKVQTFELVQNDPQEWMKNIIHLAGGWDSQEQKLLRGHLDDYEKIVSDTLWGAGVISFYKSSTDPIEELSTDRFYTSVDSGVALINFFGHSTGELGFDINIDDPEKYNNYGKYFFLIANGCFSGNIHLIQDATSEDFVLAKDKGAVGYIASSSLGIRERLNGFTNELVKNIAYKNYGSTVGKLLLETYKYLYNNNPNNDFVGSTIQQITYHGDPVLKFPTPEKPDYKISSQNVFFTPNNLTSDIGNFEINMIVYNIGMAITDSFYVDVIWTYPDGTSVPFRPEFAAPLYKDTLSIQLPMNQIKATGLNSFSITLDVGNEIEELDDYINNQTTVTVFISSDDILPIYPYKFSIVDTNEITLMASTADPFQSTRRYEIEIDTTNQFKDENITFSSKYVKNSGGVIKWNLGLPITKDSTVYFWRIRFDTLYEDGKRWFESTFMYIKDGPMGWNQSNFSQLTMDNEYSFIEIDTIGNSYSFEPTTDEILCTTGGSSTKWYDIQYFLNNTRQSFVNYCENGEKNILVVAVIDRYSLKPWPNPPQKEYGSIACLIGKEERWFVYRSADPAQRDSAANLINNIVPDSTWVLVFGWRNNYAASWDTTTPNLVNAIESLGTTGFDLITANDDYPFIILGKKGAKPGIAKEVYPDTTDLVGNPPASQALEMNTTFYNDWTHGYIQTEVIGPAKSWGSLTWGYQLIENSDSIYLDIYGVEQDGTQSVLFSKIDSLKKNLSSINASQFPYLKLQVYLQDRTIRTPPKLKMLRVIYEPAPEFALTPNLFYSFHNDTLEEGDNLLLKVAVENISDVDGDSLLVEYSVIDKNRNVINLGSSRNRKLLNKDTLVGVVKYTTKGLTGYNTLVVDVNPNYDQPEQYRFNNIGLIPFYVNADKTSPILDVAFDGIHILDGDIVSPSPEIVIKVSDNNKFIALDDTSSLSLYIKSPDEGFVKVTYTGGELTFYPADLSGGNEAMVNYDPVFTKDGTYQLKVEAQDASSNRSGKYAYIVSFEVINKSTITNIINYPNPFSTSTRFVFVLTGSLIPTDIRIQIMTISGKVVREITNEELGTIRIGRNITDFAWDGTDKFGDRLANGVYLYRVSAKIEGADIEQRDTDADQYFTNGFGKMYLLR